METLVGLAIGDKVRLTASPVVTGTDNVVGDIGVVVEISRTGCHARFGKYVWLLDRKWFEKAV